MEKSVGTEKKIKAKYKLNAFIDGIQAICNNTQDLSYSKFQHGRKGDPSTIHNITYGKSPKEQLLKNVFVFKCDNLH